jgi:hypothetical protein
MSGRRPVVKIIAQSLSQHDENPVVPTPLSGIRIGRRRNLLSELITLISIDWLRRTRLDISSLTIKVK